MGVNNQIIKSERGARKLYPNHYENSGKYPEGPSNYKPIIQLFGECVVKVDDDDYSGDSRILYMKVGRPGYLIFGWGSCSGCDSLQMCESYEEIDKLIEELREKIQWFNSKEDALNFFINHDWEGDCSWGAKKEIDMFIKNSINYLNLI